MTVTLTDDEYQTFLLTLAYVALDRPCFDEALRSLASKFGDQAVVAYDDFKFGLSPQPAVPTFKVRLLRH